MWPFKIHIVSAQTNILNHAVLPIDPNARSVVVPVVVGVDGAAHIPDESRYFLASVLTLSAQQTNLVQVATVKRVVNHLQTLSDVDNRLNACESLETSCMQNLHGMNALGVGACVRF